MCALLPVSTEIPWPWLDAIRSPARLQTVASFTNTPPTRLDATVSPPTPWYSAPAVTWRPNWPLWSRMLSRERHCDVAPRSTSPAPLLSESSLRSRASVDESEIKPWSWLSQIWLAIRMASQPRSSTPVPILPSFESVTHIITTSWQHASFKTYIGDCSPRRWCSPIINASRFSEGDRSRTAPTRFESSVTCFAEWTETPTPLLPATWFPVMLMVDPAPKATTPQSWFPRTLLRVMFASPLCTHIPAA
mmetsp:Transcript_2387/g.5657  ORF Transcript_2387/g.5657 Transcript_2387/m.5657 type:complete len:248 (+) Transcript_2387:337-1080(+)